MLYAILGGTAFLWLGLAVNMAVWGIHSTHLTSFMFGLSAGALLVALLTNLAEFRARRQDHRDYDI